LNAWRITLEARDLGSISINVRITAVRKLAVEAADNGLKRATIISIPSGSSATRRDLPFLDRER
jgi:hypothetical protein